MHDHKCFAPSGTTTVGERGQVVIPADIREKMQLKTGDKLFVFTRHNRFIGLVRTQDFDAFLDKLTGHFTEHIQKIKDSIKRKG